MLNTVYVGIDVSKSTNVVYVMDNKGDKLFRSSFPNNSAGTSGLMQRLSGLPDASTSYFKFGLEATGQYGNHLSMALRELDLIPVSQKEVHVLNPRQVSRFKDAYAELPKTDSVDAFIIADSLRFGRIGMKGTAMEEKYLALQQLTRLRFQYAQDLTREKNRYLNTLFLKFSTMAQMQAESSSKDKLFSNTFGATAMDLVNDFDSIDVIAYTPIEDLTNYLQQHSRSHFKDPAALAQEIHKAARNSYRLPKAIQHSVNESLAFQTNTIRFFEKQLKEIDKVIQVQLTAMPNVLISIPGIGPVYSAGILAEIGNISRFKNDPALAKYAGLAWNKHQSGHFEADHTPGIQSGNRYLRYYLLEAANKVRVHEPEMKAYYGIKYRETNKTPHKRALVLTARKLVRLIFALLKDNRLYSPVKP